MLGTILSVGFTLFLLMDAIGNIPIYLTILQGMGHRRRQWIIIRELVIALIVILFFAYLGEAFLEFLNISKESIYMAGGIVLFVVAMKMIFPESGSLADAFGNHGEPLIFPLAIPLVAGPSVLAAVMIYSLELSHLWILYLAIFCAWAVSTLILFLSIYLQKWLGDKGIKAMERLMGLLLILIAINMFLEGIRVFQETTTKPQNPHYRRVAMCD